MTKKKEYVQTDNKQIKSSEGKSQAQKLKKNTVTGSNNVNNANMNNPPKMWTETGRYLATDGR